MKNKIAVIAALLILAGGVYYVSTIIKKKKEITFSKESAIEYIINAKKSSNASVLAEFEEDYLPVYTDLPQAQEWQVVNYVENQRSAVQAFEETCMIEFIKQIGDKLYKKTAGSENWALFEEKYAQFKSINEKI